MKETISTHGSSNCAWYKCPSEPAVLAMTYGPQTMQTKLDIEHTSVGSLTLAQILCSFTSGIGELIWA